MYTPPPVMPRLIDPRHLTDALDKEPRDVQMALPVIAQEPSQQVFVPSTGYAAGITLVYNGDANAVVTVRHYHLMVLTASGTDLFIDLSQVATLSALVAQINTHTNYTAALDLGANPAVSPLCLLEMDRIDVGQEALRMFVSTSVLWAILQPIAWAIEDAYVNFVNGLLELDVGTADNGWLDVWGSTYGNVVRNPGEVDNVYSTRIIKEVVRQRLTPAALGMILSQDLGLPAGTVVVDNDLYADVMIVGRSKIRDGTIIGDWVHSRTVFFVDVPGGTNAFTPAQCAALPVIVGRNRMAGTYPVLPWLPHVVWPFCSTVTYEGYVFHAAAPAPAGLTPIFDSVGVANQWGVSITLGQLTNIAPLVPYPWFIVGKL